MAASFDSASDCDDCDDDDVLQSRSRLFRDVGTCLIMRPGRNKSVFADIEGNSVFQNTTLTVIVFNALWMAIDVEYNHPNLSDDDGGLPLEPFSTLIENFFCAYFTMEVVIRFLAFKRKRWWCMEGMFVFDTVLVVFMVLEVWLVPLIAHFSGDSSSGGDLGLFSGLRLLRLARITRMVKLMALFPELVTLVKGTVSALKATSWVLLFLIMIMYVFAIIFTTQLGDADGPPELPDGEDPTAEILFSSMGSSFMTLLTNGVLGDNLFQTMDAILTNSVILFLVFTVFFVMSSLMLLNMLIGVLCQVVDMTAQKEEEQANLRRLRKCLTEAFEMIDENCDGKIGRYEWKDMAQNKEVKQSLISLGIPADSLEGKLQQLEATIFPEVETTKGIGGRRFSSASDDGEGLTLDEFMEKMKELHPDSQIGALDLEDFKAHIESANRYLGKKLDAIGDLLQGAAGKPVQSVSLDHGYRNPAAVPNDTIYQMPAAKACEDPARPLRDVPLEILLHVLKLRC